MDVVRVCYVAFIKQGIPKNVVQNGMGERRIESVKTGCNMCLIHSILDFS